MPFDPVEFARRPRVTDGACGTELQKRGLTQGACPELWNVENPDAVREVAQAYVEAGSEVILTNSFGGNRFILGNHGAADRVGELMESSAALAREAAAGTEVKVFGSMGPTGKIVMMEEVAEEDIRSAFAEQAAALARGGADALVIETFHELAELRLALEGAISATDLAIICCMTFSSGADARHTIMGDAPADLAALADELGVAVVGANCGVGPENYVGVAAALRAVTDKPIWVKANAGLPVVEDGRTVFPMPADEFASYVPALIESGVNYIGGCCGTNPEFIRAIKAALPG